MRNENYFAILDLLQFSLILLIREHRNDVVSRRFDVGAGKMIYSR